MFLTSVTFEIRHFSIVCSHQTPMIIPMFRAKLIILMGCNDYLLTMLLNAGHVLHAGDSINCHHQNEGISQWGEYM